MRQAKSALSLGLWNAQCCVCVCGLGHGSQIAASRSQAVLSQHFAPDACDQKTGLRIKLLPLYRWAGLPGWPLRGQK